MPLKHKNSDEANKHTPKGFDNASNFSRLLRDEIGQSRYTKEFIFPKAIDFVDGSAPPPTSDLNDVYVIVDMGGGSVHASWGSMSYNDWGRQNGTTWGAVTPTAGDVCFDSTAGIYKIFGTSWGQLVPDAPNIYDIDGTIGSGREATITDTLSFLSGRIGIGATPDASSIIDVTSTTKGSRPFPQVTTAQMNAISTPATNLVVYNTDLSSLMRYDGANWVSMASGYGLFSVTDSSGIPTFYDNLQDALETCKTSGGVFTVKFHSNVVITTDILIKYTGTGTGNGYQFDKLTIDFNGYKLTNAQSDASDCFDIFLSNSIALYQEIIFLNGTVIRTNGTGTHYALNMSTNQYATVQMSKMKWYCENSYGAYMNLLKSTDDQFSYTCDLGGSVFISDSTNYALWNQGTVNFSNFNVLNNSSAVALYIRANCFNFTAENTSTGDGVFVSSSNNPQVFGFVAKSNSGKALRVDAGASSMVSNFFAKSVSGIAVNEENGTSRISNFTAVTGNAVCMVVGNYSIVTDGKCYNNSSSDTISAINFDSLENVKAYNAGSGYGIDVLVNSADKKGVLIDCVGQSGGGKGGRLYAIGASRYAKAKGCTFISDLDTSSGHALEVDSSTSGEVWVEGCSIQVKNTGANGIYASSAQTIKAINNTIIGATTPINANVTVSASTDLGDGNRSY